VTRRLPIAVGLVSAALLAAALLLVIVPEALALGRAHRALDVARQRGAVLERTVSEGEEAKAAAARLSRESRSLGERVPATADLAGGIRLLEDASSSSGLRAISVSPGAPVRGRDVAAVAIPATVHVVGTFFQVDGFLFRVQSLPRATMVRSVRLQPGPRGLPELGATVELELYTTDLTAAGEGGPAGTGA